MNYPAVRRIDLRGNRRLLSLSRMEHGNHIIIDDPKGRAMALPLGFLCHGLRNELPRGKPRGIRGETTTWNESPRSGLRGNHIEASFGVWTRGAISHGTRKRFFTKDKVRVTIEPGRVIKRRETMKRWVELMVCLFLAAVAIVPSSSAADAPPVMVGRIYHIEGSLLRYVAAENDWVAAVRDAPFSAGDTLYTGNKGMAELIVPNGTWIRIGDNTQIQFIALDSDLAEMDVASGVARFYNKGSDTVIKATSPFGYVLVYPGGIFDFYVGESSAEVVAVKGKISFVHAATNTKYEVSAGNPSILADQSQVTSGDSGVDPNWDGWNRTRENFWASKGKTTGRSVQYLPPALRHDAYVFEENGGWEKVYYDGSDRWFWRPTTVSLGWAPFTAGRWTEWDGDQTWIPAEPFGYVTHHYGNWIYVGNRWYWAPPVATVTVGLPLLNIGFFWNPGRVSWIHSGQYVGWVPLAPRETYYSHRNWGGPHGVVVTNVNLAQININLRNYAYARHAVVIPQRNFSTVNNYRNVRVTNINNTTIINNYKAAPVVNNTVINNYTTNKQRYNFANVQVKEKPHTTVIKRINENQKVIQQGNKKKASVIEKQVKGIQEGKVNREARIEPPKTTNYIVPANQVNRPKSEIKLQQREIKRPARAAQDKPGEPRKPSPKPGRPSPKPEGVETQKPGKPISKPEGVVPSAKPGRPAPKPEGIAPDKPDQPTPKPERVRSLKPRPAEKPEDVTPVRPTPKPKGVVPSKPAPKPEVVAPARPAPKPERVVPAKPGQTIEGDVSEKPAPKRDRVEPAKPQPKEKPEKLAPTKDEEPDQPNKKPVRGAPAKVRPQDKQKGEPDDQEKPK